MRAFILALMAASTVVTVSDFHVSNVTSTSVTLSWLTDAESGAQVNYGLTTSYGSNAAGNKNIYNSRVAEYEEKERSCIHWIQIAGLTPETGYHFEVVSGDASHSGEFRTAVISFGSTYTVYGRAYKHDGITPAEGAIVYLSLTRASDQQISNPISILVPPSGIWALDLGNLKDQNTLVPFAYSTDDAIKVRIGSALDRSATRHYTVSGNIPQDLGKITMNNPPEITSAPITIATESVLYQYNVETIDVDNDPLTFDLTIFPGGMAIDAVTGLISWTPSDTQAGIRDVMVKVTDGHGVSDTQNYTIDVAEIIDIPDPNLKVALREASGALSDSLTDGDLANLTSLDARNRGIIHLTGLEYCVNLQLLHLDLNQISNLQPLVDNPGLDAGDTIYLQGNPLSYSAINTDIPILQGREVNISFDSRISTTLTKISGDAQTGGTQSTLPNPFVVKVKDQNSDPFRGVPVTFTVKTGGGSLDAETATTDADGLAVTTLTLGPDPGTNMVEVAAADIATRVIFTADAGIQSSQGAHRPEKRVRQ